MESRLRSFVLSLCLCVSRGLFLHYVRIFLSFPSLGRSFATYRRRHPILGRRSEGDDDGLLLSPPQRLLPKRTRKKKRRDEREEAKADGRSKSANSDDDYLSYQYQPSEERESSPSLPYSLSSLYGSRKQKKIRKPSYEKEPACERRPTFGATTSLIWCFKCACSSNEDLKRHLI